MTRISHMKKNKDNSHLLDSGRTSKKGFLHTEESTEQIFNIKPKM